MSTFGPNDRDNSAPFTANPAIRAVAMLRPSGDLIGAVLVDALAGDLDLDGVFIGWNNGRRDIALLRGGDSAALDRIALDVARRAGRRWVLTVDADELPRRPVACRLLLRQCVAEADSLGALLHVARPESIANAGALRALHGPTLCTTRRPTTSLRAIATHARDVAPTSARTRTCVWLAVLAARGVGIAIATASELARRHELSPDAIDLAAAIAVARYPLPSDDVLHRAAQAVGHYRGDYRAVA